MGDAVIIAEDRGFGSIRFKGNYNFPNTTYITKYKLIGDSSELSTFIFENSITAYCTAEHATVSGSTLGLTNIDTCIVDNYGGSGLVASDKTVIVRNSILKNNISVPNNYTGQLLVLDCFAGSTQGQDKVYVNLNNAPCNIAVRGYSGGLTFLSSSNSLLSASIDLEAGGITLDETITSGSFKIRGVGTLDNNAGNGILLNTNALLNKETVAVAV